MLSLEDIHSEVLLHLAQHPDGDSLEVPTAALMRSPFERR
jgi:hypothetical protein